MSKRISIFMYSSQLDHTFEYFFQNANLRNTSEYEFAYKFICIDQGALNILIYRSERDIRQIQPDQKYTPTIQPDQKPYNRSKQQKNMFRIKGKLRFCLPKIFVLINFWHIHRHILSLCRNKCMCKKLVSTGNAKEHQTYLVSYCLYAIDFFAFLTIFRSDSKNIAQALFFYLLT